jgi:hypothetical protein
MLETNGGGGRAAGLSWLRTKRRKENTGRGEDRAAGLSCPGSAPGVNAALLVSPRRIARCLNKRNERTDTPLVCQPSLLYD